MIPREVVLKWLEAFNNADVDALGELYSHDAVNHQMPNGPVTGREAIVQMFKNEFEAAPEMYCIPLQIIEEGKWAVLEWRDPKNFAGCGFFEIVDGQIKTQRGYWDRLTFNKLYGIK